MNDFHTGLFDCCKSEHTLHNGRVIKFSRLEPLKAFICPCLVLEENTRRLDLEPNTIYCQKWNCFGYWVLGLTSAALISSVGTDAPYFGDDFVLGAAALHASERNALIKKYEITTESDPATTCFKTYCCSCCSLAQESREITIREQMNDPYQPPSVMEIEQRLL